MREYDFDAFLKLAILSEVAPKALAPQIAMNSAYLTSYKAMRESKNLWKGSAGTSFGSSIVSSSSQHAPNSGPVPMDVGAVDMPETKGKGKGKSNAYKNNDGAKGEKRDDPKEKEKERKREKTNTIIIRVKRQKGKDCHAQFVGLSKAKVTRSRGAISMQEQTRKVKAKAERKERAIQAVSMRWTKTIMSQQQQQSRPC